MAVPHHIESYGLMNAYSGRMQVFSASRLVLKKGGMKDFLSSPEKHKKQALTSSEKKQQYFGKLFAEIEDRFEELKQQLFSRLRETLVDEIELYPMKGHSSGMEIRCNDVGTVTNPLIRLVIATSHDAKGGVRIRAAVFASVSVMARSPNRLVEI